jgi:hypothetical protein
LRVNKETSELFGVPMSINNSNDSKDKNGFNFCTLQKILRPLIEKYSTPVTSPSDNQDTSSKQSTQDVSVKQDVSTKQDTKNKKEKQPKTLTK